MPRATMSDVARELGVSKNTVSLALRHDPQIPERTRTKVLEAARRLGYATNPVLSHLMAELRRSRTHGRRNTLALINAYRSRDAFGRHPTIPTYVEGCRRRAAALGYGLDLFWLYDPELDGPRLNRILEARGIRGLILVGTMDDNRLPSGFSETWGRFACAVTGVRSRDPELSFCCVDHHALVLTAVERARDLGYRRPALVIEDKIDRLVEGRFSSGMWVAQRALPEADRVPMFTDIESARADPSIFHSWRSREKPDVLLTLYNVVRRWVEGEGLNVPGDIGLIQLERRANNRDWAAMEQHNDLTGEAAVDMVVGAIHNNEFGVPEFPRATLIEASWVPGETVRRTR